MNFFIKIKKYLFDWGWNGGLPILGRPSYMKERFSHFFRWPLWAYRYDYDWDYSSLLRVMRKKISHMADCIEKHGNHLNAPRDVKNMRRAVYLIDRILSDNYMDLAVSEFRPDPYSPIKNEDRRITVDGFLEHRELSKIEEFRRNKYINHLQFLENQDYDELFKLLRKHMREWWD